MSGDAPPPSGPFGRRGERPPRAEPPRDEPAPSSEESPPAGGTSDGPPSPPRRRARSQPPATGYVAGARPRRPSSVGSPVSWVVGVAVVLILGYITVNTLTHQGGGSRGVEAGDRAPAFAMPLAGSTVEGDSNLRERAQDGHPAACDVRGKDVLNICELYEQGPTAVIFIATRSRRCIEQLDVVERVHRRFPQWRFAGVSIRGDRGDLRWDLAKGRWTVPLGYDRDGATANAYSVAVCPTVTFIRKGGVVAKTSLTFLDDRELAAELSRLG